MSTDAGAIRDEAGHRIFTCHSTADPPQVWAALTDPAKTAVYLYDLALHSTWAADAPLEVRHQDRVVLTGSVLCSHPHERLSYVLQAVPEDPPLYLTWLIRPSPGGSAIHLQVDEIECADSGREAEDTWLPVLARLQKVLDTS